MHLKVIKKIAISTNILYWYGQRSRIHASLKLLFSLNPCKLKHVNINETTVKCSHRYNDMMWNSTKVFVFGVYIPYQTQYNTSIAYQKQTNCFELTFPFLWYHSNVSPEHCSLFLEIRPCFPSIPWQVIQFQYVIFPVVSIML